MKSTIFLLLCSVVLFCTSLNQTQAQASSTDLESALGFSETVNDVPEAPIDNLLYATLLVGGILGFRKFYFQ